MRDFDWKYVPAKGLVLLTAVDLDSSVCIADFRDTHAIAYKKSGGFIGQSWTGGMRLGRLPLHLVDGIWYMLEDGKSQSEHSEILLNPQSVILRIIP